MLDISHISCIILLVFSLLPFVIGTECEQPSSLEFCSMVTYPTPKDENNLELSARDAEARASYDRAVALISRFDCSLNYSLHSCEECHEAYKYWICAVTFPKCGSNGTNGTICSVPPSIDGNVVECTNQNDCCDTGRRKTCSSICEDVPRKCPYILSFDCPYEETQDYSRDIHTCNKLDRPSDFPASFAS